MARLVFDGWIAGLGTSSGLRIVVGHWSASPYGPMSDVMVERGDGRRLLLAPTEGIARFIASTYAFDDVAVGSVDVRVKGATWSVAAGALRLEFSTGGRPVLGRVLRLVPGRLAGSPRWSALPDRPAAVLLPGPR